MTAAQRREGPGKQTLLGAQVKKWWVCPVALLPGHTRVSRVKGEAEWRGVALKHFGNLIKRSK